MRSVVQDVLKEEPIAGMERMEFQPGDTGVRIGIKRVGKPHEGINKLSSVGLAL